METKVHFTRRDGTPSTRKPNRFTGLMFLAAEAEALDGLLARLNPEDLLPEEAAALRKARAQIDGQRQTRALRAEQVGATV